MSKKIGEFLSKNIPFFYAVIQAFRVAFSTTIANGFFNSCLQWSAVDRENKAVPWFTYAAISYLETLDLSKKTVFEYGAGNSTLYFLRRAKSVTSSESDEGWYNKLNVDCVSLHIDNNDYVNSIKKRKYDIIVIDGKKRLDCAKRCYQNVKKNGIIILDNSEVDDGAADFLSKHFLRVDFAGHLPIVAHKSVTSFFFNI